MRGFLVMGAAAVLMSGQAAAEETRQPGAHEHGSGALNIAFDGNAVAMELEAPGADIVGFEYAATSEADRAKVETAIADLSRPLDLFSFPAGAECTVTAAQAALVEEEGHHDEHAEAREHDDEHGEEHGDHDEEHAGHEDDHEAEHTEFHAEYVLDCADPSAIDRIEFAYFERFPNALEVGVQVVSDTGAKAFEVERADPVLDLRGMF